MGNHTRPRSRIVVGALIASVVVGVSSFVLMRADAATAFSTVQPGNFTGSAFDACAAPSSAQMKAWKSSPYKAVGVYIGGGNRGCAQPNLTAAWVKEQVQAGWRLIPLYVGPQATCTTVAGNRTLIDNAKADAQGRAAASDAVAQAGKLGLTRQSVIIYDMEAYRTDDPACRSGVLAFMNGWTARLHDNAYFSGYYSSVTSGVADQVASYAAPGYAPPDYVDFARWDQKVALTDALIPDEVWPGKRRMKQYQGGHKETYGGVTINIDNNYVDYAILPSARSGDFTGNGWSDLAGRSTGGAISVFPGNGTIIDNASRRVFAGSWTAMNALVRIGDLNRDGKEDLVARQTNGDLWFYPGTTTGVGARKKIGAGWTAMREITPIGDLNQDGYPDLLALSAGNNLYLYLGQAGTKVAGGKLLSGGWGDKTELAGPGDLNSDGVPDLVARVSADSGLYLFPGKKGGFTGTSSALGIDATDLRDVTGAGDFDRDGRADLIALQKSTGNVLLYRGTGSALRDPVKVTAVGGLNLIF